MTIKDNVRDCFNDIMAMIKETRKHQIQYEVDSELFEELRIMLERVGYMVGISKSRQANNMLIYEIKIKWGG